MTLLFAGPRHDDLDRRVPVLRAGPPTRGRWSRTGRRSTLGRPRAGRDAAPVPAGVDRAAPLDRAVRVRRPSRSPAACRSTTARGPATACPTSGPSPSASTRALRARQPRADPQGRLRPVRRRVAHVHRDALRPGGDPHHRRGDPRALQPRARARLRARGPPDADDRPKHGMPVVRAARPRAGRWRRARPGRLSALLADLHGQHARSRRPWSGSRPPTGPRSGCCPSARASSSCRSRWPRS